MKKSITVSINSEKLSALEMYLGQKNLNLSDELEKYSEQLYQKYVPSNVREFIELTAAKKAPTKKTAAKKTTAARKTTRKAPAKKAVKTSVLTPQNSEELEKAFVKGEQPETVNGPVHIKDELPIYLL